MRKASTSAHTHAAGLVSVTDTADWRTDSFILRGIILQRTVTRRLLIKWQSGGLLNTTGGIYYYKMAWLTTHLDDAVDDLAEEVNDKDVVRQDDVFRWIEPVTTNHSALLSNPGETITFKAKLTDASGAPRSGVRVMFTAVLRPDHVELDAPILNPAVTHIDDEGMVRVTVTVPETSRTVARATWLNTSVACAIIFGNLIRHLRGK